MSVNKLIIITVLACAAVLLPAALLAQDAQEVRVPTEEDIIANTVATDSPYYYTNLMMKYELGEEELTPLEYYYLYYGYAYQEDYQPFAENRALDEMFNIVSGINPEQPTVGQLEALIERGIEALEDDPFNPKVLNLMAFAYGALDDPRREQLYYKHLTGVLGAIEMSGTGLREESPWHILMFSHAYDLLSSMGYVYNESRIISRSVEFIPLTRKTNGIRGFYFDYSRIYQNRPEGYSFRRDRTWQFNNLRPREY